MEIKIILPGQGSRLREAILDEDNNVVPVSDMTLAWSQDPARRRVARDKLKNGLDISTVFLVLNHGYGDEDLWFETMVFADEFDASDLDMNRYTTWKQAEQGHFNMVKKWDGVIIRAEKPGRIKRFWYWLMRKRYHVIGEY